MNEHDNWRTWDKHRDCRGPTKVRTEVWRKGQYEDLSMDAPPDEDKTDDEPEGLVDDYQQRGSMRKDKSRENWRCSRVHGVVSRVRGRSSVVTDR